VSARSRQVAGRLSLAWLGGLAEGRFGLVGRARLNAALARRTRVAFQDLGPAFIKLGQMISVRPDLVPAEWVFEMERLQDSVPAVPAEAIRRVIVGEFGAQPEDLFAEWDDVPIASASIAQVHRARLREACRPVVGKTLPAGSVVAVKVVKPGAEASILADIDAARSGVKRLSRIRSVRRFNLPGLLDEFASTLCSECELRNEARVADRLAFDLRDDPLVIIPRVVWPFSTRRVMTTEFVEGWRLSEITAAEREGIDGYGLALHGAEVFMRQVLQLGRFHADLHPANTFVTPDGRICYLDFGIVGRTEPSQRTAIAQVLAATVYGDADRAIRYSAELGLVVPNSARQRVVGRIDELMQRTLKTPPRDIRSFAIGFLGVMNDERVEVPVGYGLLIKALVTVEGVARKIYPDIDIVDAAKPYATKLVASQLARPEVLAERLPNAVRAAMRELVG
jgi:ubiquinone biosynthesis protein